MINKIESVLLFSANAKKLGSFYEKTFGLQKDFVAEMGEDGEKLVAFKLKGAGFAILDHSKIKGKAKEPSRTIINFEVGNIKKEFARLKKAKVKVHEDIYHVEGYGYIATFVDPDGNYLQIVQVKG